MSLRNWRKGREMMKINKTMRTLFVGSNPSHASRLQFPFAQDTKSGKQLRNWTKIMGISDFDIINISDTPSPRNRPLRSKDLNQGDLDHIIQYTTEYSKIITLGAFSSSVLKRLKIQHFKLPHPSPRNRQLNDHKFVEDQLIRCKEYLIS